MPLISTMIRVVHFLGGSSTRNRPFFLTPQNILIERENVPSVMTATTLSMWVRSDGEELTRKIVDAWNAGHDNKIELTVIPSPQMVTKFATAAAAGDVPDILSIDLIFMPDFMKAGFLTDITDQMKDDPFFSCVIASRRYRASSKRRRLSTAATASNYCCGSSCRQWSPAL
ncbi:MAG TPA: extracellular solute-binding protein [Chthoniobacterales bacterium]|nr:extracellular solute-binding protein [Chthoniobacterales bacterium]